MDADAIVLLVGPVEHVTLLPSRHCKFRNVKAAWKHYPFGNGSRGRSSPKQLLESPNSASGAPKGIFYM
jgi:hypothetical protein